MPDTDPGHAGSRTVGVEEEFLLVGADGVPRAGVEGTVAVARRAAGVGHDVERELKQQQVETATATCTTLDEVAAEAYRIRHELGQTAVAQGLRLAALGTSPLAVQPRNIADERADGMIRAYGWLAREMLTCGCHVHVSVNSRAEGVAVLDRIRLWLPVLQAVTANSPYWQGQDTGYASYRTVLWNRLPTAGQYEPFGSVATYEGVVEKLLASEISLDRGTIYFDARLSDSYPTVEIRVADTVASPEDVVLLAGLCRALVETAAAEARAGQPPPAARLELVRAAVWRAARSGLSEKLLDARTGDAVPASDLLSALVAHVRPALAAYGDEDRVESAVAELLARGTGADQQRATFRRRAALVDVVDDAVDRTTGPRT